MNNDEYNFDSENQTIDKQSYAYRTGYSQGYNTAKKKYRKEVRELKERYEDRILDHTLCYPFNVVQSVLEDIKVPNTLEECEKHNFSEQLIQKVLLERLTERERKVVELHYAKKMTYREIARMLEISLARVNTIMITAKKKIEICIHAKCMDVVPYTDYLQISNKLALMKDLEMKNAQNAIEPCSQSSQKISIYELNLSTRSYNSLRRAKIQSIEDLIECYKRGSLNKIRNLGKKSIQEIQDELTTKGYLNE